MQMIRWREKNELSFRQAGELFGLGPSHTYRIEKGLTFPRPEVALRIELVTEALGPEPVTISDHLEAWRQNHPQESIAQRTASRTAVRAFNNAVNGPKEGQTHGKQSSKR